MFSTKSKNLCNRMSARADKAGGEGYGFDPITLATLFLNMLPQVMALFAACKKQPPTPPPVPQPLADSGVTEETWGQAYGAKFAAEQCVDKEGTGFSKAAISRTAKEIAKAEGIKKKAAKPLAIASLETARDEKVEALALTMQEAKDNPGL